MNPIYNTADSVITADAHFEETMKTKYKFGSFKRLPR